MTKQKQHQLKQHPQAHLFNIQREHLALYIQFSDGEDWKRLSTTMCPIDARVRLNTPEKRVKYLENQMNGWVHNGHPSYTSASYKISYIASDDWDLLPDVRSIVKELSLVSA